MSGLTNVSFAEESIIEGTRLMVCCLLDGQTLCIAKKKLLAVPDCKAVTLDNILLHHVNSESIMYSDCGEAHKT